MACKRSRVRLPSAPLLRCKRSAGKIRSGRGAGRRGCGGCAGEGEDQRASRLLCGASLRETVSMIGGAVDTSVWLGGHMRTLLVVVLLQLPGISFSQVVVSSGIK